MRVRPALVAWTPSRPSRIWSRDPEGRAVMFREPRPALTRAVLCREAPRPVAVPPLAVRNLRRPARLQPSHHPKAEVREAEQYAATPDAAAAATAAGAAAPEPSCSARTSHEGIQPAGPPRARICTLQFAPSHRQPVGLSFERSASRLKVAPSASPAPLPLPPVSSSASPSRPDVRGPNAEARPTLADGSSEGGHGRWPPRPMRAHQAPA